MKKTLLLTLIFLSSTFVFAKEKETGKTSAKSPSAWTVGSASVVSIKGQTGGVDCTEFSVQLLDTLKVKMDCGDYEESLVYSLANSKTHTVSRKYGNTTITKYGYMTRSPQVSQTEKSRLRVPFVEEIIHLRKDQKGNLAFYFEKFQVDEFGRVVQKQRIQAHSLELKRLKISSY